jgi:hypothetical protein
MLSWHLATSTFKLSRFFLSSADSAVLFASMSFSALSSESWVFFRPAASPSFSEESLAISFSRALICSSRP